VYIQKVMYTYNEENNLAYISQNADIQVHLREIHKRDNKKRFNKFSLMLNIQHRYCINTDNISIS